MLHGHDVRGRHPIRRPLADAVSCLLTLGEHGQRLQANALAAVGMASGTSKVHWTATPIEKRFAQCERFPFLRVSEGGRERLAIGARSNEGGDGAKVSNRHSGGRVWPSDELQPIEALQLLHAPQDARFHIHDAIAIREIAWQPCKGSIDLARPKTKIAAFKRHVLRTGCCLPQGFASVHVEHTRVGPRISLQHRPIGLELTLDGIAALLSLGCGVKAQPYNQCCGTYALAAAAHTILLDSHPVPVTQVTLSGCRSVIWAPPSSVQVNSNSPGPGTFIKNEMKGFAAVPVCRLARNTCLPAKVASNVCKSSRGIVLPSLPLRLPISIACATKVLTSITSPILAVCGSLIRGFAGILFAPC